MKIVAFAGSNSKQSINKQLVEFAVQYFDGNEVEVLDLNDYEMPLYSIDREVNAGIPALANEFAAKIDAADLIIMSLAEHNSSYSVAFKNIFDWISRIKNRKHFGEKPVFLMATSPGAGGGKHVLAAFEGRAPYSGANVIETFSLPLFGDNFAQGEGIVNPDLKQSFEAKVHNVKNFFA